MARARARFNLPGVDCDLLRLLLLLLPFGNYALFTVLTVSRIMWEIFRKPICDIYIAVAINHDRLRSDFPRAIKVTDTPATVAARYPYLNSSKFRSMR